MTLQINLKKQTAAIVATIAAEQGSWKYQVRCRRVRYVPVALKSGKLVWGSPEVLDNKVNGGNIRDGYVAPDYSPYMMPLTPSECLAVYAYGLTTYYHMPGWRKQIVN